MKRKISKKTRCNAIRSIEEIKHLLSPFRHFKVVLEQASTGIGSPRAESSCWSLYREEDTPGDILPILTAPVRKESQMYEIKEFLDTISDILEANYDQVEGMEWVTIDTLNIALIDPERVVGKVERPIRMDSDGRFREKGRSS